MKEKSDKVMDQESGQRASVLQSGDQVLIRNVGLKGRSKLVDKWVHNVYEVVSQPDASIPVYLVKPEQGGRTQTLHQNQLLPCGSQLAKNLDDSSQTRITDSKWNTFKYYKPL